MSRLAIQNCTARGRAPCERLRHKIDWNRPVMGSYNERFVLSQENRGVGCFAQAAGGFDERIQYFLQVERRTADDLEYVGCGGLARVCFGQGTFKSCDVLVGAGRYFRPGRLN